MKGEIDKAKDHVRWEGLVSNFNNTQIFVYVKWSTLWFWWVWFQPWGFTRSSSGDEIIVSSALLLNPVFKIVSQNERFHSTGTATALFDDCINKPLTGQIIGNWIYNLKSSKTPLIGWQCIRLIQILNLSNALVFRN